MYVVFGHTLYGKTDVVPGFFHVATRFAHIYYIPLFPVSSYLVLSRRGAKFHGVPIPLSTKSILLGWGRAAAGLAAGGGLLRGLIEYADPRGSIAATTNALVFASSAFALLTVSYLLRQLTHASADRALSLANKAGFPPERLAELRRHFKLTDDYSPVHAFPVLPAAPVPPAEPAVVSPLPAEDAAGAP